MVPSNGNMHLGFLKSLAVISRFSLFITSLQADWSVLTRVQLVCSPSPRPGNETRASADPVRIMVVLWRIDV